MYIHQKNLFFGSINMYFELPHGDSTMQLAGYIGRIIPIPNWDWSEVSHWLASHEIPMKCPWNPIYIYIYISGDYSHEIPICSLCISHVFFPRITFFSSTKMQKLQAASACWEHHPGPLFGRAHRVAHPSWHCGSAGGKTAMGPWEGNWESRLKHHDLPENCVVFMCSTYLLMFFWFFLYVYRSVSIKNDGWSKKIWGINMKKPWKIGKPTENLAVMGTLVH